MFRSKIGRYGHISTLRCWYFWMADEMGPKRTPSRRRLATIGRPKCDTHCCFGSFPTNGATTRRMPQILPRKHERDTENFDESILSERSDFEQVKKFQWYADELKLFKQIIRVFRLAAMYTNTELDSVRDKKDKLQSKLFTKLIISLVEPEPESVRGHWNSLAKTYRCEKCQQLIEPTVSFRIPCIPSCMRLQYDGSILSYHVR